MTVSHLNNLEAPRDSSLLAQFYNTEKRRPVLTLKMWENRERFPFYKAGQPEPVAS